MLSILIIVFFSLSYASAGLNTFNNSSVTFETSEGNLVPSSLSSYTPQFDASNQIVDATITPIFTPDNAEDVIAYWLNQANESIDLELQYIKKYDNGDWQTDSSPLVQAVINALGRGVNVRVILNNDTDDDNAASFLQSQGAQVRYLDLSTTLPGYNHNKGIIIDNKTVIISSINWSKNAFRNNREAGVVVQSQTVANYYLAAFDYDFSHAEPPTLQVRRSKSNTPNFNSIVNDKVPQKVSTIPVANYTGQVNVTMFVGPDNAYETILKGLNAATKSIYVEMYSISHLDIVNALIQKKQANPSIDIKIIISARRATYFENQLTYSNAEDLVDAGIEVYNSSSQFNFQHAKFWVIDNSSVYVYSGNWAVSSIPPPSSRYSDRNREWGIAFHNQTIAAFYQDVIEQDLKIAEPFRETNVMITNIKDGQILKGTFTLSVSTSNQNVSFVRYKIDDSPYVNLSKSGSAFSATIDTTQLANGIHSFTFEAVDSANATLQTRTVKVNIINDDEWKLLITEVFPNPENEEQEFVEIYNGFNYSLILDNWKITDNEKTFAFQKGTTIDANQVIVIVRNATAFKESFNSYDYEFSDLTLSNNGDEVILLDATDSIIDGVAWGSGSITGVIPAKAPQEGLSLQRVPALQDTNDCTKDFKAKTPNPGEVELQKESSSSETSLVEPTSYSFIGLLLGFVAFYFIGQRKRKENKK